MSKSVTHVYRFSYHAGRVAETFYRVRRYKPATGRLVFEPGEGPPEGCFNGLKLGRLGQFEFYRSSNSATLIIDKAHYTAHAYGQFMARVERLKRKGIMQDETPAGEQTKVELHVIHTSCKECVFAEYEPDDEFGHCQTGCSFGRLAKYREQGADIVEAHDNDAGFYIVNGRNCPAFRSTKSDWAQRVHPENRAAAVRQELTVRTDVVVPLLTGSDVEGLARTVDSLHKLALKPASVTVVNNQGDVKTAKVVAALTRLAGGLNWNLVDVRERDAEGARVDLHRCLDMAARKLKGHFYTVLPAGQRLPASFTSDLSRAVVDDMARFVVLTPAGGGVGLTVSLGFHNAPMVDGNKAVVAETLSEQAMFETPFRPDEEPNYGPGQRVLLTGVVEKAAFLAEQRKSPHLVARAEDVCPSLA